MFQLAKLLDLKELRTSPRHGSISPYEKLRTMSGEAGFLAETSLPAIGFVTLVVPRASVARLTAIEGTPVLQARMKQLGGPQRYENIFSTIQGMFGRLDESRCTYDRCVMLEDERSWNGSSDLIVCFRAPVVSLLLGAKQGIRIALHISNTYLDSMRYVGTLSVELCVFEAGLDDPRVKVTRQHTIRADDIQIPETNVEVAPSLQNMHLAKDLPHAPRITTLMSPLGSNQLQYHLDVSNDVQASKALTNGKQVSVVASSPCTLTVLFGDNCPRQISFPMPVSLVNNKLRIARKSQWVEVAVATSLAGETDGYNTNPFPIATNLTQTRPSLTPWSLPYAPLDKYSKIPLEPAMNFSWTHYIFSLCHSDAEHTATTKSPMTQLKDSIKVIFYAAMGMSDHKLGAFITNFHLAQRDDSGINTLIMVDAVRHDPITQCIVLDAYAVPLTLPRVRKYSSALAKWTNPAEPVLGVSVEPSETRLWKYFLPACAERCRTYPHKASCEYKVDGVVPRSLEVGKSAICSCGEGKVSASFMKNPMHAPFAKIATRVAIAPLFPVPYVEEYFGILTKGAGWLQQMKHDEEGSVGGLEKCAECGKNGAEGGGVELKKCAKCKKAAYYGRDCQTRNWRQHKKSCKV